MKYLILKIEYSGNLQNSRPLIVNQCDELDQALTWLRDEMNCEKQRLGDEFILDYDNYSLSNADQTHFIIWNIDAT